jgi:hypothetical protein
MTAREWDWWTSRKLEILEDYLQAFATAFCKLDERIYLDFVRRAAGQPRLADRAAHLGIGTRGARVQAGDHPHRAVRAAFAGRQA